MLILKSKCQLCGNQYIVIALFSILYVSVNARDTSKITLLSLHKVDKWKEKTSHMANLHESI